MSSKRLTAHEKARLGKFLSMRELSEVSGFGENKINELKRRPGFPLFEGKTTLAQFRRWAFANANPATPTTAQPNRPNDPAELEPAKYQPFR
jgi:hypothetical protein